MKFSSTATTEEGITQHPAACHHAQEEGAARGTPSDSSSQYHPTKAARLLAAGVGLVEYSEPNFVLFASSEFLCVLCLFFFLLWLSVYAISKHTCFVLEFVLSHGLILSSAFTKS